MSLSSTGHDARAGRSSSVALATLFGGTFVMGSAELVVVGVLDLIAADVRVTISTAGLLVTTYALGIAIGGPLLTALTIRLGRKPLLVAALGLYVVGTAVAGLAESFGVLLAARVATGALQGLFIGVAFAVGTSLVPPERMGRAISAVLGGVAVSTAAGVPLGTLLAQASGWRAAFLAVTALGVVVLAATLVAIPRVPNAGHGGLAAQARHALAPRVLAVLGTGFLIMGGQFAALTYISPFLADVTGISGPLISVFLLAYGIANAVGTFAGGRAADRAAATALVIGNVLLVVALGALAVYGEAPVIVAVALVLWGVVGFGLVPSLQYRVVSLAGPGRDLASTLPASAVTAGIAAGALIGGWAVAGNGGIGAILTGLILCAVAVPLTVATRFLRPPAPATGGSADAAGAPGLPTHIAVR
jgi:DHA1 family inner membrane transport protein